MTRDVEYFNSTIAARLGMPDEYIGMEVPKFMTGAIRDDIESLQFYYYPEENSLYDEGGFLVPCVYKFVTVDEWRFFKQYKSYLCCKNLDCPGTYVELIKVENEEI